MEKELDINIIKETQSSLGKYIKRPPLNEKLLRKPPFRFLHDIFTNVLKSTGFFDGLFNEKELISDNVKDRESKILFLNKIITVLALTTGKTLLAKPSKIVAGQEPDKTNELLQCLGQALDKKLTSNEAVKKYFDSSKNGNKKENKDKPENKIKEEKVKSIENKTSSRSNDKIIKPKRDTSERAENNDRDKKLIKPGNVSKPSINEKEKSNVGTKKQIPSKKQPEHINVKEKSSSENVLSKKQPEHINAKGKSLSEKEQNDTEVKLNGNDKQEIFDSEINQSVLKEDTVQENTENNTSITNGADIVTTENITTDKIIEHEIVIAKEIIKADKTPDKGLDTLQNIVENNKNHNIQIKETNLEKETKSDTNNTVIEPLVEKESKNEPFKGKPEIKSLRPPSVRPSSSRPGAPRLRERHDETYIAPDNLLVGKVNIIIENTPNEEEDETSLILVDDQTKITDGVQNVKSVQSTSNQHGHLVQQILESQKEFSQNATGKTEIEWEFDSQKAKDSSSHEVEQMRLNIEALSRISHPMGKLLDHIQEDVEVMRQEVQQWTDQYHQASSELNKQKTVNEESLQPFLSKTKQLDIDIKEKQEKINDLKVIIFRNTSRINNLLSSGDVQ